MNEYEDTCRVSTQGKDRIAERAKRGTWSEEKRNMTPQVEFLESTVCQWRTSESVLRDLLLPTFRVEGYACRYTSPKPCTPSTISKYIPRCMVLRMINDHGSKAFFPHNH